MSPENGRGRDGGDRATPDTASKPNSIAPAEPAANNLRAWLIGFALVVQRADVAMIALVLAGWPR